jgi:hypothetical protein
VTICSAYGFKYTSNNKYLCVVGPAGLEPAT